MRLYARREAEPNEKRNIDGNCSGDGQHPGSPRSGRFRQYPSAMKLRHQPGIDDTEIKAGNISAVGRIGSYQDW
jgi:hypothetical protein